MNEMLKNILDWINSFIGNYGWSVVIFTLLIRLIIMPFDYKSRVGMRKTTALQPQIAALQKKYAKDQEKLNRKMGELYKKEGVSPWSSCLPMLLTMPILFAMFAAMRMVANEHMVAQVMEIVQGRMPVMDSWLWVKNIWMPDSPFAPALPDLSNLTAMGDSMAWWTVYEGLGEAVHNLPVALQNLTRADFANNLNPTIELFVHEMQQNAEYVAAVGNMPGFPTLNFWLFQVDLKAMMNGFMILPVLSAATQFLMTAMQPAAPTNPEQAGTNNFMKWFFPLFFAFICINYNAIFALYFVASNIIAAVQTFAINKYLDNQDKKAKLIEEENK